MTHASADGSTVPAAQAPEISILIVGFQSAALIGRCITSIAPACTKHSYEVLMVDQGDGSTEALVSEQFPEVTIVPSQGNLGFAGGNNLLARSARGSLLLLLNPDVVLKAGAIDALMIGARTHGEASAWGGISLDQHGTPDIGNTVHVPSLGEMASRIFGRSSAALPAHSSFDEDSPVEALSGGFALIAREAWDEAGGLDDSYFLYCEEVDFFYRLSQSGHRFWRIAAARARHDIGHGEAASPTRTLYRAAGVMQFAQLHWPVWQRVLARALMWTGAMQRYLIGTLLGPLGQKYRNLAAANRILALKPGHWMYGYDKDKGLLAKMQRDKG